MYSWNVSYSVFITTEEAKAISCVKKGIICDSFVIPGRITSRFPDDPRQPFWDEDGAPMKPLAKLTLTRQRLYKKSCGLDDVPFQETDLYDDHGNSLYCHPSQAKTPFSKHLKRVLAFTFLSPSLPSSSSCTGLYILHN